MKQQRKILSIFSCLIFCIVHMQGQETIPATGVNSISSGGSVSYSAGQITSSTSSGTNGTVARGVQQPYEISVVTAIKKTSAISLECTVYPNPTRGVVELVFESPDYENLSYRLYDINGVLLRDKKVESRETEISMENLSSSVYLLKITIGNKEVKVFKIVKR